MKILDLVKIILSYKKYSLNVLFFEIYYFLAGYKQASINILNHDNFTDNIPCTYFFLHKIRNFLYKNNIKSFIDLGCGGGRSIYFFNKKLKIKYYGIEYNTTVYEGCKNLFIKNNNIKILNKDFMSLNFLDFTCDCYFINDPLRKNEDFKKLVLNILEANNVDNKVIYFIVINVDKNKREIFNNYKLIDSIQADTKSYYIYSNKKIL